MKVLITNNHLFRRGGSETFTYALAKEFERREAEVHIYTVQPGVYSLLGGNVVDTPDSEYDLILISHNTCIPPVSLCKGPKVFTAHGTYPPLEQPHRGADYYVAISEEVQAHLTKLGFESTVIRNGIDCDQQFFPKRCPDEKLQYVLSLAQGPAARSLLERACKKKSIQLIIGDNTPRIEKWMDLADLVVSLGRGAYEAMASGKVVLVYDHRFYMKTPGVGDGLVTLDNWETLARCNFSGRATGAEPYTVEDIMAEFDAYDAKMGTVNRTIAYEHFNVKRQADAYLALVS